MLLEGDEVLAPASPMFAPIAVRPMVAAVPLAAGGAGRVQRRSKLAPVVPSASAAASGAGLPPGLQPGLQADEESAGAPAAQLAPAGAGAGASSELPEIVNVNIDGATALITRRYCYAGDLADVFKIDTTKIVNFHKNAIIEKAFVGPHFKEMWKVRTVLMAFAPEDYSKGDAAKRAVAKTKIADYPSRMELEIKNINVSLLKIVTQKNICTFQSARLKRTNIPLWY
jgi:hypothetical protein